MREGEKGRERETEGGREREEIEEMKRESKYWQFIVTPSFLLQLSLHSSTWYQQADPGQV